MASILLALSILTYTSLQKTRAQRAEKKSALNRRRFAELERDNARRIARAQGETCCCRTSTSDRRGGGGCEVHGCVGAGGPLGYGEGVGDDGDGGALNGAERRKRRRDRASVHEDATAGEIDAPQTTTRVLGGWYPDDRYRRGEDDGALGEKRDPRRAMSEGEVRRKRVKAGGGFRKWVLRRKRGGGDGDAVVR